MINNYLSANYNIPLSADDEYTLDDVNFDFRVIGARRTCAIDNSTTINSDNGFIKFDNLSPISNGGFIYAGSNLKDQTAVTPVCEVGNDVLVSISIWRFQTSGGSYTGDLTLDTSLFGSSLILDASVFTLLFDDAQDFVTSIALQVAGSINGSEVIFPGIMINDGDYFRFEYSIRDVNSPAGLFLQEDLKFHFEANTIEQLRK